MVRADTGHKARADTGHKARGVLSLPHNQTIWMELTYGFESSFVRHQHGPVALPLDKLLPFLLS